MRKISTSLCERYGKARIISRRNKVTGEHIDYKVYDADHHVVLTTAEYQQAHDQLMTGNMTR